MPTPPFSMRLDPDLRARLAAEAKRQDRSESYIAARAIDAFLQVQQIERAVLRARVEQGDNAQFIPAEAVGAWVDSWFTEHELPAPTAAANVQRRS